jgi:guanine deaminase
MTESQSKFMQEAIDLSRKGMEEGKGGPFGCVIVKDGVIIGRGNNSVLSNNDPTAHAEVVAIRDACRNLGHFQLDGCEVYTSCEPCPMCLGAIYWARPSKIYFANNKTDAAIAGFDDEFIYDELEIPPAERTIPMIKILNSEAIKVFEDWITKENKKVY